MKPHPRLSYLHGKIRRPFQVLANKLTPLRLLAAWFFSILILTLVIFLKFYFVSVLWLVTLDIIFYFIVYYALPVVVFLRVSPPFFSPSDEQVKARKWRSLGTVFLFFGLFLFWIYSTVVFLWFPDYITCVVPIVVLIGIFYRFGQKPKARKKLLAIVLTLGCLVVLPLPYFSAQAGYAVFLDSAASANNQVGFVSQGAMKLTGNSYLIHNLVRGIFQSHEDLSKFLMSGAGACGETAMFEEAALEKLGFETMEVGFLGEDHAFVEVKTNLTWQVIDPGYGMTLVSRNYRASARINETGTISYVTGNYNGTFVELTQEYVSTDTITIRVTQGSKPMGDASVTLIHQLRYGTASYAVAVPGDNFSFHTDSNGTIVIHLGRIGEGAYSPQFSQTDPFYQIYVNGQPTDYRVNSTGTGLSTFMPVDLSKR